MKTALFITILLSLSLLMSCGSQPQLVKATVEPELVSPGDQVNFQVKFTGKKEDMKQVYLTVREYPYDFPMIPLDPDNSSSENVWKSTGDVPYEAYPGEYHLDINAFLKDGKEVVTQGFEDNTTGKAGSILVKVK